jgi:ABC-type cobalamin/Fe3+-siderophores transport system ATPase subunit
MEAAVEFQNVSFFYPERDLEVGPDQDIRAVENPDAVNQVFAGVSASLPAAMMAIVGRNGIGKSTLLLLAGGRLFPQEGTVQVFGTDTKSFIAAAEDPEVEEKRNRLVSFVYQNMEFESRESVGELMEFVYENGFHESPDPGYLTRIQKALEMEPFLAKRTQQLAKGQLQRAIIGFSLLYGSRIIMLDEPVFALEEPQKDRAFSLLHEISREQALPVYYSVHNLDLSEKYSDYLLIFEEPGGFTVGPTAELFTRERLERAYQAPLDTLYQRDQLYREVLIRGLGPQPG